MRALGFLIMVCLAMFPSDISPLDLGEGKGEPELSIRAEGNEYEGFLFPLKGPLNVTEIEVTLPCRGSCCLAGGKVTVWRVVDSRDPGKVGTLPEGTLIPDRDPFYGQKRAAFPLFIPSGQTRNYLIEVFVPPGSFPGEYQGKIRVVCRGRLVSERLYRLTVGEVTLSSTPSFPVLIGVQGKDILARHFGAEAPAHQEEGLELAALYLDRALMNRASLSGIFSADWRLEDFPIDWEEFDRTWSRYLEGRDLKNGLCGARINGVALPPSPEGMEPFEFWAEFCAHFRDQGWFDRLGWWLGSEDPGWAKQVDPELPIWDRDVFSAWGWGGFFVPGNPEVVGGTRAIPLDTLNARYLRDRIEDQQAQIQLGYSDLNS